MKRSPRSLRRIAPSPRNAVARPCTSRSGTVVTRLRKSAGGGSKLARHGNEQLAVALVQAGGVAANLGEELRSSSESLCAWRWRLALSSTKNSNTCPACRLAWSRYRIGCRRLVVQIKDEAARRAARVAHESKATPPAGKTGQIEREGPVVASLGERAATDAEKEGRAPRTPRPWPVPSIASDLNVEQQRFRVTHPFHPWFGREFALVTYRLNWGEERVYFHDDAGRLVAIPARWTSVFPADPFVVVSAGRSPFCFCAVAGVGSPDPRDPPGRSRRKAEGTP